MNTQLIDKSYQLFVNDGYNGTKDEFINLIQSNESALQVAHGLYAQSGEQIGIDEYKKSLQGEPPVKKKDQPAANQPKGGVSKPAAGSLASQGPESFRAPESIKGRGAQPVKMEQVRQAAIKESYIPEFEKTEAAQEAEAQLLAKPEEIVYEVDKGPKYGRKESKYFTGGFGDALDALSNPFVPGGEAIADFIDDMGRSVGTGLNNAGIITPSNEMMIKGPNVDRETISKYLQAAKEAESLGPSDEMSKFYNIYEAEGKDLMGLLKGLAYSPGAVPELIVSSFSTLLNPSSAAAAASTIAGFTAGGATAGAVAGGVGAIPGAVGGFLSSIPWAMGAASASLETGLTFSELLRERIEERGLEFNEEGVRKILEDQEAISDIRNKSLTRGATIGAVDALTGRLAGRVGAKLAAGTNASRIKAAIAAGGIEAAGGSAGEATARAAIGQEMDVAEIGLEGIAEVPMAIPSVVAEVLKRPSYKVNGEVRSEADVEDIINTSSPEDLAKIKIEVKNDTKGLNNRIQEKIVRGQISTEVKESNPDLSEEDANSIVDLEMELNKFKESKTQSGKDRAAAIRSQIKTIQENAVQKQAAGEVPVQPTAGVSQTMEEGKPQPEPQVTTTEGVQEEAVPAPVTKEKVERNLDEGPEQNKGIEISSLKKQINAGLGEDMSLTPEEVTELSKTEFTVLPKEDIDKSDVNKPIILIRKRGTPKLSVSEALQDAKEEGSLAALSDYFEIVDGRHRIKKAIESGVGLNAVVITEQQYESATGIEMLDKEVKNIVDDLEVNTLDEAISELQTKIESAKQRREYNEQTGRDAESDLEALLEEKQFREKTFEDENIQDIGVPSTTGIVQQEQRESAKQKEPATTAPISAKREQVKSSIERLRDAGLVRSAETGKPQITQEEIDAQMALTDAMAAVWRETTGKDDFYDTFIDDIKEGNIDAIREKGGALFQDEESPKRPISRVTLEVFEKPEFQKMRGQMVSPNSISDLMKSRGKAIEKEIISTVLNYSKYKDQKKISFDQFRDDVETQVMKLEKIRTSSYSSYGMDNLGSKEDYGSAETIILNSPINHGKVGHFPNDFTSGNIEAITWEIKQIPGTEQYVAIDANMPRGISQDQLSSYIGTAGPYEDVKKWIDTRNNTSSREKINVGLFGHIRRWLNKSSGIYNLAELQSDYFQKNKASYDLYAQRIPVDQIDEHLNKNFFIPLERKTSDALKKEFGLTVKVIRVPESETTAYQAIDENGNMIEQELYSDAYTPKIGYTLNDVGEPSVIVAAAERIAEVSTEEKKLRFFEIKNEYYNERRLIKSREEHQYIKGRVEEMRKTEGGASMLNQFIASQKIHELRLFREALKDAAESGAAVLRFPSPYTIAVIEGYVNDTGSAPYDIISGNSDYLYPGDQIEYAGDRMTVVESSGMNITVAPAGQVFIIDESDAVQEEVDRQVEDALYNLKQLVDDIKSITKDEAMSLEEEGDPDSRRMGKILNDYFRNNPEEETVSWDDVEQKFSDYVYDVVNGYGVEDLVSWASEVYYNEGTIYAVESRRATESFAQPNNYQSDVDESDFMESLDDDQETVVKKYQELGDMIRKMRPDAKIVEDENGKKWIETSITDADKTNPVIAFQEEGGRIKGAIDFSNDNKASIYIFDGADISTLAHEATGHLGRRMLEQLAKVDKAFDKDYKAAMKWAGVTDGQWTVLAEEKFARGFERYLAEGKAPTKALKNVFEKLKTWLTNIYKYIKGSSIDIELTPEITTVFDNLLRTKQEVTSIEEGKPEGYDRMMGEFEGIVKRMNQRGEFDPKAIMDSVMEYVMGSKAYENATDTQREALVREIRKKFGAKEKKAPSVNKILGILQDAKKVTVNEMTLIKKAIKDMNRGAKDAISAWRNTSALLAKEVKDLVTSGRVTVRQAAMILNRFSSVNMFNPSSIDKFVDYVERIMNNAEYQENLAEARSKLPRAKANLRKLGIAEGLMPNLQRLLSINPSYIPESVFGKYRMLLDMLSKRDSVLKLDEIGSVKQDVNEILDALNEQESMAYEFKDVFDSYQDKELNEDGTVNFTETINKMVDDGSLDAKDAKVLKKYESIIMPEEEVAETEEDLDQMRDAVMSSKIDNTLAPTRLETHLVNRLARLIKTNAVNTLNSTELNNLLRVIDNINNGYVPHMAQLMVERLEANNDGDVLQRAIDRAKLIPLSKLYSKIKSAVLKKKDAILTMLERNPWFVIDQLLGDFKTKEVFNAVFQKIASASSRYESEVKKISERLDKAETKIFNANKKNHNKTMMSKFKIMTYLLELEHQSNPGSKKTAKASEFLKKTIDMIESGESQLSERDAEMLQKVLEWYNKYSDTDGNVDVGSIYDSFNDAEKSAIKVIQDINKENTDKAIYTQVVIRGEKMDVIDNYVHHNVISKAGPDEDISGLESVRGINRNMMPSTRGKSLISRTPGAKAINFDPFQATQRGADYVLLDFHMTEPIRVMRKALNFAKAAMKENKAPKDKMKILNAISKGAEQTIHNTLATHYMQSSIAMDALSYIKKTGYRAILASVPRFISELTSNMSYALIAAPKAFVTGASKAVRKYAMSADGPEIMKNVGSVQVTRIYPSDLLSGRMIDSSIMQDAMGKNSRTKNAVANRMAQINNMTLKPIRNAIETTADAIISTPDKLVSRPIWFGSFANEFKALTGSMPDFDLIAANDETYMNDNADAIAAARQKADTDSIQAGASDNPFVGVLKGSISPDQDAIVKGFNMFNSFMTRFLIYEYTTARTGVMAMVGRGSITKQQGAALLGGVTSRMILYSFLTSVLSTAIAGMFVDDEEEDEKSLDKRFAQSAISAGTSMVLGRDFGNMTKSVLNYGIERVNESYFDFLREGDYDPYKDAIQYDPFPKGGEGKTVGIEDYAMAMSGPFSPMLKTLDLTVRTMASPPKKEADAIERLERTMNERIPLEWAGHLGFVPLYKDIRNIVVKDINKGIKNKKKEEGMTDEGKKIMKMYYPDQYERMYGKGTPSYEIEQQLKEYEKSIKNQINPEKKDKMTYGRGEAPKEKKSTYGRGEAPKEKKMTYGRGE